MPNDWNSASYTERWSDGLFTHSTSIAKGVKGKEVVTEDSHKAVIAEPQEVKGLIAFYPNVRLVPPEGLDEYLEKLANDNNSLVATYSDFGFKVIWFPVRGEKSSHMEIWPLCHARKKLIVLQVGASKVVSEKRAEFCDVVLAEFRKRHPILIDQLMTQGFMFSWRISSGETRIVLY